MIVFAAVKRSSKTAASVKQNPNPHKPTPMNTPKYDNIKFGQFQPRYFEGIIKSVESMESKTDQAIAAVTKEAFQPVRDRIEKSEDICADRIQKIKSILINSCKVFTMNIDDELGEIEVYARFGNVGVSPQSEQFEDRWIIECVKCDGEEITLNNWQQQIAYETIINKKQRA